MAAILRNRSGERREIGPGMPGDYMTYDQRFAARAQDVLAYQTEPPGKDDYRIRSFIKLCSYDVGSFGEVEATRR
jgi:hypothetical protein